MSDFEEDDIYFESDTSEEDALELLIGKSRVKNENFLGEIVPHYDDETFFQHFRIKREHMNYLAQQYENSNYFSSQTGQHGKIAALNQILIYTWCDRWLSCTDRQTKRRCRIIHKSQGLLFNTDASGM
ncbi:hypothetical protein QE152_g13484 [Popillia japonica]|uniref:Uncharacterized protein n=1 Tax=Popillia japonica TaxID=7064 RepID=A0AAW1L9V1_POPJA